MERIKTGIAGFDELIQGGIPEGFNVLVTGAPGTGKTIFGLQYLYEGAMEGQNGVYVSLETSYGSAKFQGEQFGWNINKLETDGKLSVLEVPLDKSKINLFEMIEEEVADIKAKRLVFDSLAAFAINMDQFAIPLGKDGDVSPLVKKSTSLLKDKKSKYDVMPEMGMDSKGRFFYAGDSEKRITYLLINELAKLGTTNLVITDANSGDTQLTVDGVSEYVCDGLLFLDILETSTGNPRIMQIKKMRETNHRLDQIPFEINSRGIVLKPIEGFLG